MNALLVLVLLFLARDNARLFAQQNHHSQSKPTPEVNYNLTAIIMSHGRSGSGVLCAYVLQLANAASTGKVEIFGGNIDQMKQIANPNQTMIDYFISAQKKRPGKLVQFKWKPLYFDEHYLDALKFVAQHQIKVVYSTRNPLDVTISAQKYNMNPSLNKASHCKVDDIECIESHKSAKVTIDKRTIVHKLTDLIQQSDMVIALLERYKVNYFNTTYEELNFGTKKARLSSMQRLSDFVTPGRKVVAADLQAPLAFTSHPHQSDEVTDYDDLVQTLNSELNGTYVKYIH
mmetsp:Transcript_3299/g.5529  ORF Transcript_3299/g.5529 Transcript_3299/m.5529 type:complete len:288 (-) Transcript_3299:275-1138(-)